MTLASVLVFRKRLGGLRLFPYSQGEGEGPRGLGWLYILPRANFKAELHISASTMLHLSLKQGHNRLQRVTI